MDILVILDKDRSKWLSIVINLGCPIEYSEDVLHDMYLKIHSMGDTDRFMYKDSGEVNYWYIILTLRSVCYDFLRLRNKQISWKPFDEEYEPLNLEREEAFNVIYDNIIEACNEFGRYGSKLTQMYFKTDYSLRQIASETNISLSSIFHSIKIYKSTLQDKFGEDFEDFMNGDYDKIK